MTSNNEKKLLTKSDINRVFWRSFTVNASFNYERQMSQGAQYALSPILQKLYPDKKELGEALQRHAEFFNTTPMLCPFIFGITAAMEEENATQEDFDPNTINSVKAGLMGPEIRSDAQIKELATVPSREVLLARLLGSLQSSIAGFVRVLDAIAKKNSEDTAAAPEA